MVHRSNGDVASASVTLTNMGATPLHARGVEEALAGGASVSDAAAHAADGTSPPSDHAGSSEYRTALVQVLCARALEQATA